LTLPENAGDKEVPLNVAKGPVTGLGDAQAEFEPPDAGAEGKAVPGGMYVHIMSPYPALGRRAGMGTRRPSEW